MTEFIQARERQKLSLLDVLQCILSIQGSTQKLHRGVGEGSVCVGGDSVLALGEWFSVNVPLDLFVFLCETPMWAHTRMARQIFHGLMSNVL